MPRLRLVACVWALALLVAACSRLPLASQPSATPAESSGSRAASPVPSPASPAVAARPAESLPAPSPAGVASPAAAMSPAALATVAGSPSTAASPPPSRRRLRIGLVTDVGSVDDKSFNQSAWEAVLRAQRELGAEIKFHETAHPRDYARNIDQFALDGYDIIVTVGFAIGQATDDAARRHPAVRFIGVDQSHQTPSNNLVGLVFNEDKAGYLAGALAGLISRSGVVAAVLGTNMVPPVVKFGKGFEAGARTVRSDIRVYTEYHPGGLARGFSDPDWGKATAAAMIRQQADVIFGVGGTTGNGALVGALEQNVLAIGVDTDQWETLPQVRPVLVSSAMKLIEPGVFGIIKAATDGTFKAGNVTGEVGLSPFHGHSSRIPSAVQVRLAEIEAGLKNGTIRTGVAVP